MYHLLLHIHLKLAIRLYDTMVSLWIYPKKCESQTPELCRMEDSPLVFRLSALEAAYNWEAGRASDDLIHRAAVICQDDAQLTVAWTIRIETLLVKNAAKVKLNILSHS